MNYIQVIIILIIIVYILYRWSTAKYNVLRERNIPHDKPLPLIGNLSIDAILGRTSFIKAAFEQYNKFKNSKIYGAYSFQEAIIVIPDVNLIKKIGIKDFDHFPNHSPLMMPSGNDDILPRTLLMLRDRKWKEMRSTLSPSFTGNKMRLMLGFVDECCTESMKHIQNGIANLDNDNDGLEIELKDFFTRYTNDVIATTAFGIKVNSFEQKDNEFFSIGSTVTQFKGWAMLKPLFFVLMPKVMNLLRIKFINEHKMNYFKRLVFDAIKYRKTKNIVRTDMIQLLMEAQRNFEQTKRDNSELSEHAEFTDIDLLAQCFIFFFAGFETVSSCLCCTAHELAMNVDIQEKLYAEILETDEILDGKPVTYETLMNMKYLDQVLSESLRKWPPLMFVDRQCSADYTLTDDDGNFLAELKKNDVLMIPIISIHNDPQLFENPSEFNPERFSDENKHNLNTNAYMPFGVGNRSCIGNRFALMETKLIIYHLLKNFKLLRCEKTHENLMEAIKGFQLQPADGFWIKLVTRSSTK